MWMIHPATIHDFKMSLFYLPFLKESAPVNMATDMVTIQSRIMGGTIFRRYGWNAPEITFGYGQKADWVCDETGSSIDSITRRPTGGGIVRHGTDLTYCLVAPREAGPNKCHRCNFMVSFTKNGQKHFRKRGLTAIGCLALSNPKAIFQGTASKSRWKRPHG